MDPLLGEQVVERLGRLRHQGDLSSPRPACLDGPDLYARATTRPAASRCESVGAQWPDQPDPRLDLVVIIPAYNELDILPVTIEEWGSMISELEITGEIWVIDDGSTDGSADLLSRLATGRPNLKVIRVKHGGHSRAVVSGYREAVGREVAWVAQADADQEISVRAFRMLWDRRTNADIVLGHRVGRRKPVRRAITMGARVFLGLLWWDGRYVRIDTNVPFRLFRRPWLAEALVSLPRRPASPNVQLVAIGLRTRASIVEVRVPFLERSLGRTSLGCIFSLSVRTVLQLVVQRCRALTSNYSP